MRKLRHPFASTACNPARAVSSWEATSPFHAKWRSELGGFDENFTRVAYRFEAEFAHRWRQCELSISYIPEALIDHLHTSRGGTRSYGEHLRTLRPDHAVGRYYHLLCTRPFHSAVFRSAAALFRAPRTRHHLHRPWWIPLTLLAELRGLFWAFWLSVKGPRLLSTKVRRLLIVTTHPIQYQAPLFRALASDGSMRIEVLFLTLPDAQLQGVGFGLPFTWDVPLLDGYHWRVATVNPEPRRPSSIPSSLASQAYG